MCCCYRDTKMEIQGLVDAQNTHYQHGVPRRTGLSPSRSTADVRSTSISNERDLAALSESSGSNSDNNRPRTSPFRLPAEHGSEVSLPLSNTNDKTVHTRQSASHAESSGHRNVTVVKDTDACASYLSNVRKATVKYDTRSQDHTLQMALPLFDEEDGYSGHSQQCQLTLNKSLRHQHPGGATPQQSLVSDDTVTLRSDNTEVSSAKTKALYVDISIVNEDGVNTTQNDQLDPCTTVHQERVSVKAPESSSNKVLNSMEVHNTALLLESDDDLNNVIDRTLPSRPESLSDVCFIGDSSEHVSDSIAAPGPVTCLESENSNIVLSSGFGDSACHTPLSRDMLTEKDLTPPEIASNELPSPPVIKATQAIIPANGDMMDSVEMPDACNNPEYMPDFTGLVAPAAGADGRAASSATCVSSHETFSGTIMINNQSIIVTIENGVLTLAAPPEGYSYKDDGMVSLKEHLGMKDHEDIVLLNYDSGTKSIGKISNVALSTQQEEPQAGLSVSDSELNLADDCPLSEMGAALNTCPAIKQEDVRLSDMEEGDLVVEQQLKPAITGASGMVEEDMQPVGLGAVTGLTRKAAIVTYCCPQSGCTSSFETRQKLKLHLLFHAEDQRPFKCTVEGCGWSFTTSYKLKRHLQSHDKLRPFRCEWEGCGRRFTTVYNLKAHAKAHDRDDAFVCEVCSERFRSATRLANHQRTHFEPERPFKCEFPGCEKTFITFSALFSHNRAHFRETGQYSCSFPGCDKRYDKACRLKIHLRSHTGERPFVCDSEACGWTFTSMSKLLRHKRKHDDDRRFTCPEEGCGKSFTRAEHLKGHSITHLGTKPFECHVEGCSAKFSARSSLYIHSKKHRQEGAGLRSRCPVADCTKHFSSRSSLKSHMLKHHNISADVLSQLETSSTTLTPSSELTSGPQNTGTVAGPPGTELTNLDLTSLFSSVPSGAGAGAGGVPEAAGVGGSGPTGPATAATFAMDMSLVGGGILTIDPVTMSSALATKAVDPLIPVVVAAAGADMGSPHVLDAGASAVLPQGALNLDDVQTVNAEALGTLSALALPGPVAASASAVVPEPLHALSSSCSLASEPAATTRLASPLSALATASPAAAGPDLLAPQGKGDPGVGSGSVGALLAAEVKGLGQAESKGMSPFGFTTHSNSYGGQKEAELGSVAPCPFLESAGSARTDYRAIQLAKKRKQKTPAAPPGQRKGRGAKGASVAVAQFGEGPAAAGSTTGGLTIRDPVTGAQYVQIQLLQDDPASDGDLAFQLSSQPSSSHSQLTVDLPVNILQEPSTMTEDDNGSDNSQFTGSTINLQDLE